MANNNWTAKETDFALRQTIRDISGFFSKQLTVTQGTRALVVDDGVSLGEVPPGTYTLQSFLGKLKFWRSSKHVDVVLVREEDVRVDVRIDQIATREELWVAVRLQMTVKLQDIALFVKNMMGSRDRVTVSDISDWITPILQQALRESVRQMSIISLTSPDVRSYLETAVHDAAKTSLLRYGITCSDIHAVEIVNEQYDAMRQKTGEIWLLDQDSEKQKKLDEMFDQETLRKIERREREIELKVLAEHVEIDGRQADVALAIRRNEVRRDMRDAMTAEMFDKTKTREEFETFMLEIDKSKLLREDERDELRKMFEAKKEDRELLRNHLVRQLDLKYEDEQKKLALQLAHERRILELRNTQLEQENIEQQKRREYELQKEMMADQMEQLKAMEQLNRERDLFEAEQFLKAAAETNAREIEKLKALSQASTEALIAMSDVENARILGDVEIAKNESHVQAELREQAIKRESELQEQRVKDAQSQSEVMLDTIQKITGQAFGAIENASKTNKQAPEA